MTMVACIVVKLVYLVLLNVVCFLSLVLGLYIVSSCCGCDGCCAFCMIRDACSLRCF